MAHTLPAKRKKSGLENRKRNLKGERKQAAKFFYAKLSQN